MTKHLQNQRLTLHNASPAPMSCTHALDRDGRGRSAHARRRAHVHAHADRDGFMRRWSLLMIASFPRRETCAEHFGVSFQTACNWVDGLNVPYGHHVDFAQKTLPRYREVMRGDCAVASPRGPTGTKAS